MGHSADLDPDIWPATARRNAAGALTIGDVDVRDLAREYQTPLFIIDRQDACSRADAYRHAYPGPVYYAAKALITTRIAQWMTDAGLGIDVASGGELEVALRAGVPGAGIVLHGNNKSMPEIERAIQAGVGRIVLDSLVDIVRVAAAAEQAGVVQPVLVRATLGVEAHTHEYIATAHEDQKFGLVEDDVYEAVRRIRALPSLSYCGLHSHIGSQIFDPAGFELAATRIIAVAGHLAREQHIETREVNLGGGMGIAYVSGDDPAEVTRMAEHISAVVEREADAAGISRPLIAVEPGRAIIGPAGVTLYEVGTMKPVSLDGGVVRTYVSVDGGMSDNLRTALYGATYTVTLASRVSVAEPMLVRVVGKHCETGDVVVRDAWLPSDLAPGDLLAVAATGAYCRSLASNYNLVPKPAVVAVAHGDCELLLRRETIDDLLRLDPGAD